MSDGIDSLTLGKALITVFIIGLLASNSNILTLAGGVCIGVVIGPYLGVSDIEGVSAAMTGVREFVRNTLGPPKPRGWSWSPW